MKKKEKLVFRDRKKRQWESEGLGPGGALWVKNRSRQESGAAQ